MLTNKAKQTAQELAPKVAKLLAQCDQFARTFEKESKTFAELSTLWRVWQYPETNQAKTDNPEAAAQAEKSRKINPRRWADDLDTIATAREAQRIALFVARVNFINKLNYTAAAIAELIRPHWELFALRKGFEDLGQLLTPQYGDNDFYTCHAFRVHLRISGGNVGAQLFPSSFIRLNVLISIGSPCGIWGTVEGVKMGDEAPAQEVAQPHRLTVEEYTRAAAKLEALHEKARQTAAKCCQESREIVKRLGLYGFAEFLNGYNFSFTK